MNDPNKGNIAARTSSTTGLPLDDPKNTNKHDPKPQIVSFSPCSQLSATKSNKQSILMH